MRTVVMDTDSVESLVEERRRLGIDRRDEVWDGVPHMNPAPSGPDSRLEMRLGVLLSPLADDAGLVVAGVVNVGSDEKNYRIPDLALHREEPVATWFATVALALEVRAPDDESWEKLGHYAEHRVDEVVIAEPQTQTIHWLALGDDGEYRAAERSALLELGPAGLAGLLDWPG